MSHNNGPHEPHYGPQQYRGLSEAVFCCVNGENLVKLTQFFILFCIIVCLAKGKQGVRQNDEWGLSMVVLPCKRRNIVIVGDFLAVLHRFSAKRYQGL